MPIHRTIAICALNLFMFSAQPVAAQNPPWAENASALFRSDLLNAASKGISYSLVTLGSSPAGSNCFLTDLVNFDDVVVVAEQPLYGIGPAAAPIGEVTCRMLVKKTMPEFCRIISLAAASFPNTINLCANPDDCGAFVSAPGGNVGTNEFDFLFQVSTKTIQVQSELINLIRCPLGYNWWDLSQPFADLAVVDIYPSSPDEDGKCQVAVKAKNLGESGWASVQPWAYGDENSIDPYARVRLVDLDGTPCGAAEMSFAEFDPNENLDTSNPAEAIWPDCTFEGGIVLAAAMDTSFPPGISDPDANPEVIVAENKANNRLTVGMSCVSQPPPTLPACIEVIPGLCCDDGSCIPEFWPEQPTEPRPAPGFPEMQVWLRSPRGHRLGASGTQILWMQATNRGNETSPADKVTIYRHRVERDGQLSNGVAVALPVELDRMRPGESASLPFTYAGTPRGTHVFVVRFASVDRDPAQAMKLSVEDLRTIPGAVFVFE